MKNNRRVFLKQALTGAVWISAGNTMKAIAGKDLILPAGKEVKLRIAIISDGHFGQPETKYEANHSEMVSWINTEKSKRGIDFTFINGDLFHNDISFLEPTKKIWDTLSMPYYVSHGNHDLVSEESWTKTWNNSWHYGFEKKDISFIVLNTADEKGTYISPDVEKTKQLLNKYNRKPLFVFMHITPIKWTENGISCPEVVGLFAKQSNLKAVFNGHDHDQDNVKENQSIRYFFDSHIGGSWGTPYRGYRILEIMKNDDVLTYQMNPATNEKVNTFPHTISPVSAD